MKNEFWHLYQGITFAEIAVLERNDHIHIHLELLRTLVDGAFEILRALENEHDFIIRTGSTSLAYLMLESSLPMWAPEARVNR